MIVVLSGGTGGAKFVQGLASVLPRHELTVIVNTGDDVTWWGLHISPIWTPSPMRWPGC